MRIEMVKFKSGERYPFLLQEDGTPDFWVTHFVTQKLRKNSAARTIDGYLTNIRHLKKWEQINDRDLLEEIYEGKVPNREDIKRILEHCYLRSTSLEIDKASKVVDMSKYSSSTVEDLPTISRGQYSTLLELATLQIICISSGKKESSISQQPQCYLISWIKCLSCLRVAYQNLELES